VDPNTNQSKQTARTRGSNEQHGTIGRFRTQARETCITTLCTSGYFKMVSFENHLSANIYLGAGSFFYFHFLTLSSTFYFVKLRLARNLRYPSRPRPTPLQPLNKPFTRPWDLDFNLHRLKAVHSFKGSPGCKPKDTVWQK